MALTYGAQPYGAQPAAAPVLVAFAGPAPQRRATVFFRVILAIPAVIVVGIVGIGAFVVAVIGWFGALFMGRLPTFAAEFLTGFVRWQSRVVAYEFLLTDKYPPFTLENDDSYPVWVTAQPGELNRLAVFFRLIIGFPAGVVQTILQYGLFPVAFVAWLIVLVNGTMPEPLYRAFSVVIRYQMRVYGYFLMITSEWPWGLFGDTDSAYFGSAPQTPGAYGVPGSSGAPGAYGAPPAPGAYGAPPASGAYGASPVGAYSAPPPPDPAATFPSTPQVPAAPAPPTLPGVAFTFGGPSYLWGYTDDRSFCGIWSATDLTAPPQTWPISDQGEGWARFRDLEPNAVALADPTPPPAPPPPAAGTMPSFGAAPPFVAGGSPYTPGGSPADDPRWRIVLNTSAKQLVAVILILGVIDYTIYQSVFGSRKTTTQTQPAPCRLRGPASSCGPAAHHTVFLAFGTYVQQSQVVSVPARASGLS